jgi:hypothetical protein
MSDKDVNIQITRDWNRPDPLRVDQKNPEKSYRWVDKKKLEQRQHEGWSRVDPDSVKHKNPDSSDSSGSPKYQKSRLKRGTGIIRRRQSAQSKRQPDSITRKGVSSE